MLNRVLVITDNLNDAKKLKAALGKAKDGPFDVEWVRRLSTGLKRLRKNDIQAILVDLSLPDSSGITTFDQLFAAAPHIPVLTLNERAEEPLAVKAVEHGAQGYLTRDHFNNSLVPQALGSMIQRKAFEEALYKEKTRAEIALNSIGDSVICTDTSGNVNYLNIAAEEMTGWSREEANGHQIREVFKLIDSNTRQPQHYPSKQVLKSGEPAQLPEDTLLIRRDGSELPIEDSISPIHDWIGNLTGTVIVFHDVSVAKAMSIKMAHLAQHDFLTNLPNRIVLEDRMGQAIALAKRSGTQLAVLFLDLDNFKHINDSLGHAAGDELLQSVAHRLSDCVRHSDTVCRQGGDEFVILLGEAQNNEATTFIADKILTELAMPHTIAKDKLHISTSIGISVYPEDGLDADTLIKSADTAMYTAKQKGRNNYQFFSRA